MSVDYTIKVYRKVDNKVIAEFYANVLKTIFDNGMGEYINCQEGRNSDKVKFLYSDLSNLRKNCDDKIEKLRLEIFNKNLMIMNTKKSEIREEFKEEIRYFEEEINDIKYVYGAACNLQGMIDVIVENNIKNNKPAYQYNAKDLPKTKEGWDQSIWCDNIELEVNAHW